MKKGCLISIAVFLAICLLIGACSPDSADDTSTLPTNETSTSTEGLDNTTTNESTSPTIESITEATIEPITESTVAQNTEPLHTHSFSAATCSTPKTCSCGATEGTPAGHSWKEATCSTPKTCAVCGTTSGLTAGHNFSNGECTTSGKADPDYQRETMVWIPTKGGTKYHRRAGCSNMIDPEQVTQSRAESLGFTPCKKCY